MKKYVRISYYSMFISVLAITLVIALLIHAINKGNDWAIYSLSTAIIILCLATLLYMPLSIEITDNNLIINRSLRSKVIALSSIKDIRLCPPTMAEKRICGSGGWFGYWGWFRERDLGKYFAYYGKASDCFLVVLKDGSKYMLGCKDAPELAQYISDRIS